MSDSVTTDCSIPVRVEGRRRANTLLLASLGGLALSIGITVRMRSNSDGLARSSIYSLAFKALGIGTLSSLSSLGVATACIAKYLNVYSIRDFGQYARSHLEGLAPSSTNNTRHHNTSNDTSCGDDGVHSVGVQS